MGSKFFEELSRCLGKEQIESLSKEDRRLEIFLHGQPVLSVSPGNEVFMLPSGSKNPEANELYHRVAIAADRVFEYVEAMENPPCSVLVVLTISFICLRISAGLCWRAESEAPAVAMSSLHGSGIMKGSASAMGTIMRMILQEPNGTSLSVPV